MFGTGILCLKEKSKENGITYLHALITHTHKYLFSFLLLSLPKILVPM